ncbi:MAG: hypothetical protein JWQ40_4179, partial [Segetibacter sp.]|nr:hypothetical protein [Segetibacter sp.]
ILLDEHVVGAHQLLLDPLHLDMEFVGGYGVAVNRRGAAAPSGVNALEPQTLFLELLSITDFEIKARVGSHFVLALGKNEQVRHDCLIHKRKFFKARPFQRGPKGQNGAQTGRFDV